MTFLITKLSFWNFTPIQTLIEHHLSPFPPLPLLSFSSKFSSPLSSLIQNPTTKSYHLWCQDQYTQHPLINHLNVYTPPSSNNTSIFLQQLASLMELSSSFFTLSKTMVIHATQLHNPSHPHSFYSRLNTSLKVQNFETQLHKAFAISLWP